MARLEDFFLLSGPLDPPFWWLTLSQRVFEPEDRHDACFNGTYEGPDPVPLRFRRGGRKPGVIWASSSRLTIISGELLAVIKKCKPSGLSYHPTVVYDKDDELVVDTKCVWLKLQVGCGPIDDTRGSPARFGGVGHASEDAYGYYFDPATWTGVDIFCAKRWWKPIVTRRIADAIREANIPGVTIESLPDVGRGVGFVGNIAAAKAKAHKKILLGKRVAKRPVKKAAKKKAAKKAKAKKARK